jgi:ligand-binding sensor domain-containing protein/signal transduction histidine kinase/CheY-like chemotaxis protein
MRFVLSSAIAGLVALLCLSGVPAWAAPARFEISPVPLPRHKPLTQFHRDTWLTREGLPQNSVEAIAQTPEGYIWLGTRQGLARFDGHRFVIYDKATAPGLEHIHVTALLAARDGDLWIGTSGGGLSRLRRGAIETFDRQRGLPSNVVRALFEDSRGRVWAATDAGVAYFNGKTLQLPADGGALSNVTVLAIAEDAEGAIWLGTLRRGLLRFVEGQEITEIPTHGLPPAPVTRLIQDPSGAIYVGTAAGLGRLSEGRVSSIIRGPRILALWQDAYGTLWVGTQGRGLLRVVGDHVTGALTSSELSDDVVLSLLEDREGSLWIGTAAGGLSRLQDRPFVVYGQREGLSPFPASTVYQDVQGRIWVGTDGGGLFQFVQGRFIRYSAEHDRIAGNQITSLASEGRALWVGTNGGGVSLLRDGVFRTPIPPGLLPSPTIRVVEAGRGSTLWIGTDRGVVRYRKGEPLKIIQQADGLPMDGVRVLHEDWLGALWVGTNGGGIARIENDRLSSFTTAHGLSSDFVTAFHEDNEGALWIGTYGGGLNRLKAGRFCQITTRQGLFDDVVFDLIEDERPLSRMWMNSARGIFSIPLDELRQVCEGRQARVTGRLFNATEGGRYVEGSSGQQPLSWRMKDGRLWFSTHRGVVVINPGEIGPQPPPPPVIIEGIGVDGVDVDPRQPYRATWGGGAVRFAFTAPSFRAMPVRFRYRLDPFDPDWIDAGASRAATYTNLAPGTYRFRVTSDNGAGEWASLETTTELAMTPRFYQTSWFAVVCGLGVVVLGLATYRVNVSRLRDRGKRLEGLVAERTRALQHEMAVRVKSEEERRALDRRMQDAQRLESLGVLAGGIAHDFNNLLVGILGQAGLAQMDLPPDSPIRDHVLHIERAAVRAAELTSQLLAYSGRGRFVLERVDLSAVVRELAKLLETVIAKHVDLVFHFDQELPAIEADPAQIGQVVMNLLTNASDALADRPGRIVITTDVRTVTDGAQERDPQTGLKPGRYVRLVVEDTGCGMDAATQMRIFDPFFTTKFTGRGLGLAAVQGIVRSHHGIITVHSQPGAGTRFEVLFPATDRSADVRIPLPVSRRASGDRRTVLLVDDEDSVRSVGRSTLARAGFDVLIAHDGREAIDIFQRDPDRIDCVLLDLTMPRLSGAETLLELRALREDVSVVITSGYTEQEAAGQLRLASEGAEVQGFVQKPWTPAALVAAIEVALESNPATRVLR